MEGDMIAMRLVMDRLLPPRRERPVSIEMPKINVAADLVAAAAALTDAAASGAIRPSEAARLGQLVGNVAQAIEVAQNSERIAKFEEALANKSEGATP
jgi:hypothetical protein